MSITVGTETTRTGTAMAGEEEGSEAMDLMVEESACTCLSASAFALSASALACPRSAFVLSAAAS